MRSCLAALCLLILVPSLRSNCSAQPMINQTVPFQNLNQSYYENFGVNWSLRGPGGFFANFGGGNVAPPFGGFDPNAGLNTGIGFSRGGWSGNFGLSLNQGSNQSMTTTAPSVTTMNGYPGSIQDVTVRPFVTGVTPVIGGAPLILPVAPPRNEAAIASQAALASQAAYLQERRYANASAKQQRALNDYERGKKAEEEGNLRMARANYRKALGAIQGPVRLEIIQRLKARGW